MGQTLRHDPGMADREHAGNGKNRLEMEKTASSRWTASLLQAVRA